MQSTFSPFVVRPMIPNNAAAPEWGGLAADGAVPASTTEYLIAVGAPFITDFI
jgi:hypothetical protein